MNTKTNLLFAILLLLICIGCDQNTERNTDTADITDEEYADSTYYEFTAFSREYGECGTDTSAYCTRINLSYPEFKFSENEAAVEKINATIEEHLLNQLYPDTVDNKTMEMAAARFINDYKEIKAAFGEAFGWYAKINGNVLRNDTATITVELVTDMYTGGAHGNVNLQYFNFEPNTGNKLPLSSLFKANYESQLNKIVEKKFRETYHISPDKDLSDEGYQFEEGKYYNPENFAILKDGIKFFYNSYEIAPYSSGPSEVFIPFKSLKPILKVGVTPVS
ncbi:hypothetical protein C900_00717 [Fulvivirga imtechensis AK7]|uniref:DUF3298 domain-containing protein n=1 Tax=Fulvivirga imtechensis AK7 TaxID=1237149 RepID=L8JGZ9_9BACT|nr:DUF3298 domain-containing protein [Fulvivirga imtechensis]ELR68141.1 hypothetical protein C900_00717 [Fulvivirga imtechensis AK7]